MEGLIKCLFYFIFIGILFFVIGRILPKGWFQYNRFPYRLLKWEKNGNIYRKLNVQKWKEKIPDMSNFFPTVIPSKKLIGSALRIEQVEKHIQETCIAELIHFLLCVAGCGCFFFMAWNWGICYGNSLCNW